MITEGHYTRAVRVGQEESNGWARAVGTQHTDRVFNMWQHPSLTLHHQTALQPESGPHWPVVRPRRDMSEDLERCFADVRALCTRWDATLVLDADDFERQRQEQLATYWIDLNVPVGQLPEEQIGELRATLLVWAEGGIYASILTPHPQHPGNAPAFGPGSLRIVIENLGETE